MKHLLLWLAIAMPLIIHAQTKSVEAHRIHKSIKIDGKLDEKQWKNAATHTGFTTIEPGFDQVAKIQPTVRMMYDDQNVYFGAFIPADKQSDIKTQLAARDEIANADWFLVMLDTYGNGVNAYEVAVTAAGGQFDARAGLNGEDTNWNEVWKSAVSIADDGWSCEIAIPYSALRFPKTDKQSWAINFLHRCITTGEKSCFNAINPEVQGFVNQSAKVAGVENIKSPLRLSLTPYLTTYYQTHKAVDGTKSDQLSYSGGLDVKYGINEAFTLDMTLVPDFGQVRADDNTLNLSPFELQFSENRPFFTEGTELFERANMFYSRRVGGRPIGANDLSNQLQPGESIKNTPGNTRLINATKISGRTTDGWGLGLFNAISRKSFATIVDSENNERKIEIDPLTNYNVSVVDKSLPHNSYISIINTNVTRFDNKYHNANVTGLDLNLRLFDEKIGLESTGSYSHRINKEGKDVGGYKFYASLGTIAGSTNYGLNLSGVTKDYDNNDLGFNTRTNESNYTLYLNHSFNKGIMGFSVLNTWASISMDTRFDDQRHLGTNVNAGFWGRTPSQWSYNMWTNYNSNGIDLFEARTAGQVLKRPSNYNMGWNISSDQRKRLSASFSIFGLKRSQDESYQYSCSLYPRYRFSDQFSVRLSTSYGFNHNNRNLVKKVNGSPIIGLRDRSTIINAISLSYTFDATKSLTSRVRHYWTRVDHTDYFGLNSEGGLTPNGFEGVQPYTYNGLNINTEFKWRFAPGSDIIAVWQNNISGSEKYQPTDQRTYLDGVRGLNKLAQGNTLSIRLLYYINGGSMISKRLSNHR